jgi:hypothetical protein
LLTLPISTILSSWRPPWWVHRWRGGHCGTAARARRGVARSWLTWYDWARCGIRELRLGCEVRSMAAAWGGDCR